MPDQNGVEDLGGTLRLGAYPCVLAEDSHAYRLYGTGEIQERHRHRYEVNNEYREALLQNGMKLSGISPDGRIVEMIELPDHPYFLATQAHPERTVRIPCSQDLSGRPWNTAKKKNKLALYK